MKEDERIVNLTINLTLTRADITGLLAEEFGGWGIEGHPSFHPGFWDKAPKTMEELKAVLTERIEQNLQGLMDSLGSCEEHINQKAEEALDAIKE